MSVPAERLEDERGKVIPFPQPEDVAVRKLHALHLIEDTLGIGDFDGMIEQSLARIRQQGDVVKNWRQVADEAAEEVARAEAEIAVVVASDKIKFPNDTARKAETEKRKAASPEYQDALRRMRDAVNQRDTAQMDLDDLERRLGALKGARSFAEGRLRVVASL